MNNNQIIYNASCELVRAGKLNVVIVNGEEIPEPIHTFNGWKALGYVVKKGEKSDIRIPIWKHTSRTKIVYNEEQETSSMFMKTSAFFRYS